MLDACSAHYGKTPDSSTDDDDDVYHYHVQDAPPFVVGCFGPNDDGSLVSVEQCRDFYTGCDGTLESFETTDGKVDYDVWCPCYDQNGSNSGLNIAELAIFEATSASPATDSPTTDSPATDKPTTTIESTSASPATDSPAAATTTKASSTSTKPNVIFFMPDDMHFLWDERAEGPSAALAQHTALVPNMNKVREEGVVFTEAIVSGPKCAPSRFNVLTGRYCSRSYQAHAKGGAAKNGDATRTSVDVPTCKLIAADLTSNLQTDMAAGGYETIMSGKWHLSAGTYANPYMDAEADVADAGFSNAASIYVSNMDSSGLTTFGHNLEWVTAKAIEGIDSALKSSKPFFLYFTPTNPWGQNQGMNAASLQDFTVRDTPSGTLTADPVSGMPARSTVLERAPACSKRTCAEGERDDGWVGTIAVDDSLGSLMAHLKAKGELDNTLIIVTQDHGQTAKESLYQGGVRVSLFARYPPAIRAGLVVNTPVTNIDVAPTILEFAEIAASFGIDGVSWWGAVASAKTPSASLRDRECLISEMNYDRIVVCGSMKYLSNWDDAKDAKAGITNNFPAHADAEQIYNLASDPTEQTNLVSGGTQEAFRAKAIAILKKHDADTAAASAGALTTGATSTTTKAGTTKTVTVDLVPTTRTDETTVTSTAVASTAPQSTLTLATTRTSSSTKIPPTTTTPKSTRSASSSTSSSSSSSSSTTTTTNKCGIAEQYVEEYDACVAVQCEGSNACADGEECVSTDVPDCTSFVGACRYVILKHVVNPGILLG